MGSSVTIADLRSTALPAVSASEAQLASVLSTISSGETVSNADLLRYQIELTSNSLTAEISSSIVNERGKTLKDVVQKF